MYINKHVWLSWFVGSPTHIIILYFLMVGTDLN